MILRTNGRVFEIKPTGVTYETFRAALVAADLGDRLEKLKEVKAGGDTDGPGNSSVSSQRGTARPNKQT